jgi:hypothetical protein
MSDQKHTPGPWKAVVPRNMQNCAYIDPLQSEDCMEGPFDIEDARLIASAPEMLDALKQSLGKLRTRWPHLSGKDRVWVAELAETIETAIIKAEGRDE